MSKSESEEKKSEKPTWVKMKVDELEKIVVELAKEGKSPAEIGLILRDKHGVPKARLIGKRIKDILDEKGLTYNSDRQMIEKKVGKLKEHLAKRNKHDYSASRALTKKLWALQRIEKLQKN